MRNPALPNVPTTAEAGLAEFQASAWLALFAPKATPKPILDRLTGALDTALDDAGVRNACARSATSFRSRRDAVRQALRALVAREIARWTPIIEAANVKAE